MCCYVHLLAWLLPCCTDWPLLQKNFGRPVEWQLVKEYPWSVPQLRKVDPKPE